MTGNGAASKTETSESGPTRRCLVTRRVLPKEAMVRFVAAPDGTVTPDLAGELPGRGMWVSADRQVLDRAVRQKAFNRAARAQLTMPPGLTEQVTELARRRSIRLISMARRAGQAVAGFEKVRAWLREGRAGLLLAARDGGADGRGKLARLAAGIPVLGALDSEALGEAFGRGAVVHAAVAPGRLALRIAAETRRYDGLMGCFQAAGNGQCAGPDRLGAS
jgi:hypothetical protein